jgi:hypothetical protein
MSQQRVVMNANSAVYVRLTEGGLQMMRDQAADLRRAHPAIKSPYVDPTPDERGFYQFQLWQFLEQFGPYSGLSDFGYYDFNLEFDPADLKPVGQP